MPLIFLDHPELPYVHTDAIKQVQRSGRHLRFTLKGNPPALISIYDEKDVVDRQLYQACFPTLEEKKDPDQPPKQKDNAAIELQSAVELSRLKAWLMDNQALWPTMSGSPVDIALALLTKLKSYASQEQSLAPDRERLRKLASRFVEGDSRRSGNFPPGGATPTESKCG